MDAKHESEIEHLKNDSVHPKKHFARKNTLDFNINKQSSLFKYNSPSKHLPNVVVDVEDFIDYEDGSTENINWN